MNPATRFAIAVTLLLLSTPPVVNAQDERPLDGPLTVELSIAATGIVPEISPPPAAIQYPLALAPKSIEFVPANVRHRRLLFEQPLLERHGATRHECLQPVVSGAHFFANSILFPFDLVTCQQRRCDSSLGWGTPGSPIWNRGCNR